MLSKQHLEDVEGGSSIEGPSNDKVHATFIPNIMLLIQCFQIWKLEDIKPFLLSWATEVDVYKEVSYIPMAPYLVSFPQNNSGKHPNRAPELRQKWLAENKLHIKGVDLHNLYRQVVAPLVSAYYKSSKDPSLRNLKSDIQKYSVECPVCKEGAGSYIKLYQHLKCSYSFTCNL